MLLISLVWLFVRLYKISKGFGLTSMTDMLLVGTIKVTPSLPHPLTSLPRSPVLTPYWPCPSLTLSFLPPIKPPSDLPTTFTFQPYPSRASPPLLLHTHSFLFHFLSSPIIFQSSLYLPFSPLNPHLLLNSTNPSILILRSSSLYFLISVFLQRHM